MAYICDKTGGCKGCEHYRFDEERNEAVCWAQHDENVGEIKNEEDKTVELKTLQTEFHLRTLDGKEAVYTLDMILAALGVTGQVTQVDMVVKKDGRSLVATATPVNDEYPSIYVDGEIEGSERFYLANFELPNVSYPNDMVARLYAGAAGHEYDGPIALVKHTVDTQKLAERTASDKSLTKVVYVDTEMAQYRSWNERLPMPEHVED